MPVFGNDCTVPKEMYTAPKFGPQPVDLGYHGGMKRSPHAGAAGAGYSLLDEPELAKAWTNMVDELVGKYAHDERINIWDIFNEPGNGRRGSMSMPHMINFFEAARKHSPVQPLTAGPWTVTRTNTLPEIQQLAMDLSDVISYHDYSGYENSIGIISRLKKEGRPLFNTEWLHRVQNNKVQTHLPLYWLEGVGIYNWGFVVGKSQNHEPWEAIWKRYYSGERTDYDFTQWQHELVRPNMRPYDPREYDLFVKYAKMADEEFKAKKV